MWTRTENQAKHILLNRTRDGMRVQVNVFLMKENDWRLSLGGHSSFYTPNVFKLKMTVCCLTSQSIHLFPSSAVSVWSNNDSLSKLLLRSLCRLKLVCASDGSGFCYPEVWINSVTNWRLFVCTVPSWQGGVLVDEVETPQSSSSHHRLFCSASPCLARTQHGVPTGQDFVQEAVCVCVCGSKKPPLGDRLQKMKLFLQCIETTKVLPMFLVCVCRSDEEMVKFMQLMHSIWNICGKDVVTAFDLSPFKVICDLGGKFSSDFHKSVQVCLNWAAAGSAAHLQCMHLWSPHTFWVKDFIYLLVTMSWIW